MRRSSLSCSVALALAIAAPAPASSAVRVAKGTAALRALAVAGDGAALAVVDSRRREDPFRLVRVGGGRPSPLDRFGGPKGEFPDVAAAGGTALVSWARPISGGAELSFARLGDNGLEDGAVLGLATGPGRLAVGAGAEALLAHPDEAGDVTLTGERSEPVRLTADAPERRHLPLDVAVTERGTLVLDLAQRRDRSDLVVLGEGAPIGSVVGVDALRHLDAALAASDDLVAVAYYSNGRAVLATAATGGAWTRRRLPGRGGGLDAPVPVIDGDRVHVAYVQRARRSREIRLATVSGGRVRARRLTRNRRDDRRPHAAIGPEGELYVGWTRTLRRSRRRVPLVERVG